MGAGQPVRRHHGLVRRAPLLVVGWLAAGAAAVAAASAGVAMVSDQVTESRPAPLNATEVAQGLADQTQGTTSTTSPTAGGTATTETTPSTSPPVTTANPSTPPTTAPPPPTTTPPATVRTYSLVGGTATLRFSSSGVTVVTASPNAGFDVEVEPEHGNGVKVEFEREGHKSRVSGWWEGGPRDEVREEADD